MKNKLHLAFVLSLMSIISFTAHSQAIPDDSLYLGQIPPGTTPLLFADNLMLGATFLQCARIAISKDGKEFYYTRRTDYSVNEEDIRYFKYANNKWNGSFILFPNIKTVILAPTFSVNWDTLYFQECNPNNNITHTYFSERDSNGWTTPQLFHGYTGELYYLQETNNYNFYVSVQNGKNGVGKYDICKITFDNDTISEIRSLGIPLNTTNNDAEFFIAKDESFIVLGRNESSTNRDLYISYRKSDNTWSIPKSLGSKINNGSTFKWGPFVTLDNKYLFYESTAIRWTTWWVRFDGMLDSLKHTNFPPYQKNSIPDQKDTVGHPINYQIPDSTFIDDDGNNTLTYSAKLSNGLSLPAWLSFDPATRTFSGTPDTVAALTIIITATDTANAMLHVNLELLLLQVLLA